MSNANRSTATASPAHRRMVEDCIARGWIKRVGDSYEITPAGHEYTMNLTAELADTEQPPYVAQAEAEPEVYKRWS